MITVANQESHNLTAAGVLTIDIDCGITLILPLFRLDFCRKVPLQEVHEGRINVCCNGIYQIAKPVDIARRPLTAVCLHDHILPT